MNNLVSYNSQLDDLGGILNTFSNRPGKVYVTFADAGTLELAKQRFEELGLTFRIAGLDNSFEIQVPAYLNLVNRLKQLNAIWQKPDKTVDLRWLCTMLNQNVALDQSEKGWQPFENSGIVIPTGFYGSHASSLKNYDVEVPKGQVVEWIDQLPFDQESKDVMRDNLRHESHKYGCSGYTIKIDRPTSKKIRNVQNKVIGALRTLGQAARNNRSEAFAWKFVANEIVKNFHDSDLLIKQYFDQKP